MKNSCYRLVGTRSLMKLFLVLGVVAAASLSAQRAFAQDFDFGWEPFPPSSWDGGWDASLSCKALDGNTTLTRNLTPGTDTVIQEGSVSCTFTDPANNNFTETAICSLSLQFDNLTESCVNKTLTVTGTCPTGQVTVGTINCEHAGPGGTNPTFCGYAGNNPSGNHSEDGGCQWNLGYGKKNSYGNVVGLGAQCGDAFPANGDFATSEVFKFTQKYTASQCTGEFAGLGPQKQRFCHGDTWDPEQDPFCDLARPQTLATSSVQSFLVADTEYSPDSINEKCNPNNNGVITLTVRANPVETDQNQKPIAIENITQSTITVNGRAIIPGSCTFDRFPNPNLMTCKVNRCVNNISIIANTHVPGTNTATLQMDACIGNRLQNGTCSDTPIDGDVESKKFVH